MVLSPEVLHLLISRRTAIIQQAALLRFPAEVTWQGAAISLPSDIKAGGTYSFSAAVMQASGSAQDAQITLQYNDSTGTECYEAIASASLANKTWTKLENTAFTIPAGATDLLMYVELTGSTADYYLDDVLISNEGTKSSVVTGQGVVGEIKTPEIDVDPSKPMIAISFDDGTDANGKRIIDALAKEGFTATFFYVGNWIDDESQVRYAHEKGMEIANHTTSHPTSRRSQLLKSAANMISATTSSRA